MSGERASKFASALQDLESGGDVDGFVAAVFTDQVELLRPETDQQVQGIAGAQRFWKQYLSQFIDISSQFDRIVEDGDLGVLEWTSSGRLADGTDISYRGVSVLNFDSNGLVDRFSTYFDTAKFASTR